MHFAHFRSAPSKSRFFQKAYCNPRKDPLENRPRKRFGRFGTHP
ncbi:hypothetical protein FHT97_001135 [Rhizobium sp. BK399]|nr:hypothetical protein [Rhizobium sp. BK399]